MLPTARRATALILIVALVLMVWPGPPGRAAAQVPLGGAASQEDDTDAAVAAEEALRSPEAVRELISRLTDAEVRELLLRQMTEIAETRESTTSARDGVDVLAFAENSAVGIGRMILGSVVALPRLGEGLGRAVAHFTEERGVRGTMRFVGVVLLALALGLAAEFAVNRLLGRRRGEEVPLGPAPGLGVALRILSRRLAFEVAGLIAFVAVAWGVAAALLPAADTFYMRMIVLFVVLVPWLGAVLARFIFAPARPELRLVHTDDWTARYMQRNDVGVLLLMGIGITTLGFLQQNGVAPEETHLGFWLNLAIFVWLGTVALRARTGLTMMLMGSGEATAAEAFVARAFPWAALALIAATWLFAAVLVANDMRSLVGGGRHIITLGVLLMAPIADTTIRGLVNNLVPAMTGHGEVAERAYHSTKRSYIRIGRVVVFGLFVLFLASLWQVNFTDLASAGLGARFAARVFEALFIVAAGYLVWEVVTLAVNRRLAAEETAAAFDLSAEEPAGGEGGGVGGSRLSTVLPLVRWTAQVAIIVVTALVVLGNIGIDITPLLAGAGIAGLAIGFGAQKLVADIVSGIFFLVDDAFRTGEYVEIDGTMGTVERISIRSLQLRHHRGPVHTIPFGEIPKITNYSRDWVIMKLRFTVPFDTDLANVKKIFKQIGTEMAADPVHGPDMLQPFKSQGVLTVDDVGIVVRGKFMAKPGKQFTIRKAIYDKVQKAFEEAGIQFARKEIRVHIDGDDATAEEKRRAAAAAAGEAAEGEPAPTG